MPNASESEVHLHSELRSASQNEETEQIHLPILPNSSEAQVHLQSQLRSVLFHQVLPKDSVVKSPSLSDEESNNQMSPILPLKNKPPVPFATSKPMLPLKNKPPVPPATSKPK